MRMRCPGCAAGELPIGRRSAAGAMRDDAVFGCELGHWYLPEFCGSQEQSFSGLRSGKLQIISPVLNRRRCIRAHAPIETVGNSRHTRPVAISEPGFTAAFG